jgi:hypothetical protein
MMKEVYSKTQSASMTVGFHTEEEADQWISENKQLDKNYGQENHTEYSKKETMHDGWMVKRNFYYEERAVDGKICTGKEEVGTLPDESGSGSVDKGREEQTDSSRV